MSDQTFYNRIARVLIGKKGGNGPLNIGLEIKTPLRITFDLTKTEASAMNEGKITINNLSEQTRAGIREGLFLVLEAGYVELGGLQMIFHGEIIGVSHDIKKPEVLTTINVQDGHTAIKKSKVSLSYRSGTRIEQIFRDAIKALGLPVNSTFTHTQLPQTALRGPFSYSGNAAILLDQICGDHGLQWSVQNGSFKIYSTTQTDNLPPLSSVLIGSPRRLFKDQQAVSETNFNGYEFDCLLLPKAEPGGTVTLKSKEIIKPIKLKVAEVKHSGDYYGDKWQTLIKAKDMPSAPVVKHVKWQMVY